MRYATGLKVLVGFLAFGLLILVAGREWQQARELLAASLFIGLFLALALLRQRPRRRAMQAEARRLRLRYSSKDPFDLLDEPFALVRWSRRSYGRVDNVLWGPWRDLEVRIFDYTYQADSENQRTFSCVLAAIPGGWPTLVIRPETPLSTIADHVAFPDITFESESFNRAFDVRCEDRGFANAFVDARMMEWLLTIGHRWGFEVGGRWILGYRDQVQPWEIEGVLETLATFLDKIPRAVSSLYPEALPPRPDVLG